MKIADLPNEAKPREKALCYGLDALDDQELLALIIGSGVKGHSAIEIARSLVETFITLPHLSQASLNALTSHRGLNKVTALKLVAVFELHRRISSSKTLDHVVIQNSFDISKRFHYLVDTDYEVMVLVMLNRKKAIIREVTKYKGTFDSCSINFKEIISELLDAKCAYFIMIHNHPDGTKEPSENDVISTVIIKDKAEEFGIRLFDHVVIYRGGYYSFRDHGHFREF